MDKASSVAGSPLALLPQYVGQLKELFGKHLKDVILFGSYARGDYDDDSDMDIMILLDLDDKTMEEWDEAICRVTYRFNLEHDMDIQIVTQNETIFAQWRDVHPFYKNVVKDGVVLYNAA